MQTFYYELESVASNKTQMFINLHSNDEDEQPQDVWMRVLSDHQIYDSSNSTYEQKVFKSQILTITPILSGRIYFEFRTLDDGHKLVFFSIQCLFCGKKDGQHGMMLKEQMDDKLKRLINIDNMIGVVVVSPRSSTSSPIKPSTRCRLPCEVVCLHRDITDIELRLRLFIGLELVIIVASAVYQTFVIKRLLMKKAVSIF